MPDSLGDRIKRYEDAYNPKLTPRSCLFIRVDGKAFHTWTKGANKPFDQALMDAMVVAADLTSREMQGFKLGYVQSDEATFLLTDFDSHQTQGWFGYELNKIVSVSASLFTANFNWCITGWNSQPAVFDSRAFVVPREDAPNVFIWRQQDWQRNSLQMLARAHFSHAALNGQKTADLHEMLWSKGINWADLTNQQKNGSFIHPGGHVSHNRLDYMTISKMIELPDAA